MNEFEHFENNESYNEGLFFADSDNYTQPNDFDFEEFNRRVEEEDKYDAEEEEGEKKDLNLTAVDDGLKEVLASIAAEEEKAKEEKTEEEKVVVVDKKKKQEERRRDLEGRHPLAITIEYSLDDYIPAVANEYAVKLSELLTDLDYSLISMYDINPEKIKGMDEYKKASEKFKMEISDFSSSKNNIKDEDELEEAINNLLTEPFGNFLTGVRELIQQNGIYDDNTNQLNPVYRSCREFIKNAQKAFTFKQPDKVVVDGKENTERYKVPGKLTTDDAAMDQIEPFNRAYLVSTNKEFVMRSDICDKETSLIASLRNKINDTPNLAKKTAYLETLNDLAEHIGKPEIYEYAVYRAMADSKEFCAVMIKKARDDVFNYTRDDVKKPDSYYSDYQKKLQLDADIIAVGERFLHEMNLSDISVNTKVSEAYRDFAKPNPYFDKAILPEQKDNNDYALSKIISATKSLVEFETKYTHERKRDAAYDMAVSINDKLAKHNLIPEKGQTNDFYTDICTAGNDKTLKLDNKNFNALASTGSPEYTEMHKAFADYLTASRNPYVKCDKYIDEVFEKSNAYLLKKDTTPYWTSGKKRVEAAAQIFAKSAMHILQIGDPAKSTTALNYLEKQMLRNPTVRNIVIDELTKNSDAYTSNVFAAKAFLYAQACDDYLANNPTPDGIIISGKVDVGGDKGRELNDNLSNFAAFMEGQAGISTTYNKDSTPKKIIDNFNKKLSEHKAQIEKENAEKEAALKKIKDDRFLTNPRDISPIGINN